MMLYLLITLGTMALSWWASSRVQSQFQRFSSMPSSSGMTGAQAAQAVLRSAGIHNVTIHATPGALSDHYDPTQKRLVLCEENYYGNSVAAIGVAAHEAGHAIQDAQSYSPLRLRMGAVHITQMAGMVMSFAFMGGMFLGGSSGIAVKVLALCATVIMLFQLITLPVEFDATARAKRAIADLHLMAAGPETEGMNRVLNAAAWTYVAAFVGSLGTLAYYAMMLMGNQRSEE
jgi:uncharacterized protein